VNASGITEVKDEKMISTVMCFIGISVLSEAAGFTSWRFFSLMTIRFQMWMYLQHWQA